MGARLWRRSSRRELASGDRPATRGSELDGNGGELCRS